MKRAVFRFWPLLYIFAFWFLFSSPYFLKGLVPYPAKLQVTFFSPWSAFEQWWGPVKNNAMPDIVDQIYPWKYFSISSMKQGEIPFWNPYSFAGNPHVANFQSAVFSPFNLLFFVLPFIDAWSLIVLLQPLLAGVFTYLFLRELKISNVGSVIASITFMFCGFMTVWMAYGTLAMAAAFLPLALYGIEKAFVTGKKGYLSLLTISLIVSFFSGHFQTSLYVAGFIWVYLIFRSFWETDKTSRTNRTDTSHMSKVLIFWSITAFVVGVAVSMIQIYPTIILYQNSVRSGLAHVGGGIPWNYLITAIAPDFYGNPVTRNDWYGTYAEWASFIGIIPFILGLFALVFARSRYVRFFFVTAFVVLLFAIESPMHTLLVTTKIPVLATSIPSRIIVLFSFSFAVLAGFGFDALLRLIKERKRRQIFTVIVGIFVLLALLWFSLFIFNILPSDKMSIAQKNLILPTALFLCAAGIAMLASFVKARYVPVVVALVFITFVTVDSQRYAGKWMPFDSRNLVYPDVPVLRAIKDHIGYGRIFGNIGTEVSTYYGFSSLEGYDPLYIQRYGEFIRYANDGTYRDAERSVVKVDRRGKYTDRVLDLLGVSLIYHPVADTGQGWAYPAWERGAESVVYQDDKFQLFRNKNALPRASLFYNYEVISNKEDILKRFYSENFDFRNSLILEERPSITSRHAELGSASQLDGTLKSPQMRDPDWQRPAGQVQADSVMIVSYTPNKVVIKTQTDQPALLFLSDNHYPRWHAMVNGKEKKVLRADYSFRAVEVGKGESTVEFYYKEY